MHALQPAVLPQAPHAGRPQLREPDTARRATRPWHATAPRAGPICAVEVEGVGGGEAGTQGGENEGEDWFSGYRVEEVECGGTGAGCDE
jgi:hypothetical protein